MRGHVRVRQSDGLVRWRAFESGDMSPHSKTRWTCVKTAVQFALCGERLLPLLLFDMLPGGRTTPLRTKLCEWRARNSVAGALNHIVSITGVRARRSLRHGKLLLKAQMGGRARTTGADGKINPTKHRSRSGAGSPEGATLMFHG